MHPEAGVDHLVVLEEALLVRVRVRVRVRVGVRLRLRLRVTDHRVVLEEA